MDSYKPFSTIGYNTESFLRERLDELVNLYPDMFWCYIYHRDEKDKKDHYHLYVEPNARIRSDDFLMLKKSFEEFDPNNEKPLSCMPFRKSKFEDWYLYSIHNSDYLNSKHLIKSTYDYDPSLVVTSNQAVLKGYVEEIDTLKYVAPIDKMKYCFDSGMNMYEALSYLRIPYSGMYGFMKIWKDMLKFEYVKGVELEKKRLRELHMEMQTAVQLNINDELPF